MVNRITSIYTVSTYYH